METIIQNKNRLTSDIFTNDSDITTSLLPAMLHIILHNQVSSKDCQIFSSLAPQNCSLFVLNKNKIVFTPETLKNNLEKFKTDINFSYDASFVQHVQDKKHGTMRILTIPLDKKTLFGLVSPVGLDSITSIEDAFLHKINLIQREYHNYIHIVNDINRITIQSDPTLIINRFDDQIIGWNNSALTFFNLYAQDLLEADIIGLQKNCPKTSTRKMQITNSSFCDNDFSIVRYSDKTNDQYSSEIITEELKSHAEYLLKLYKGIQSEEKYSNSKHIKSKIVDIDRCFQNITLLHNKEKK